MASPVRILHVIQRLSEGGAARAMMATAAGSAAVGAFEHRIVSLGDVVDGAARSALSSRLAVIAAPSSSVLEHEIGDADIVQIHFWNTPELLDFMRAFERPSRLLLWSHVPGDASPHTLPAEFIEWADVTVVATPYSYTLPVFSALDEETRRRRTAVVLDSADFARLDGPRSIPHDTFNVGYIGTVNPVKMHPDYVAMSAAVDVPGVRFVVCGSGDGFDRLRRQAAAIGAASRFDFHGFLRDIASALATFDVFGYPVHHCASDLVIQEAMFAGVPPVVFASGGCPFLVRHGETGLVVSSADEYSRAVEYLYTHPDERRRLGANAAAYARAFLGADRSALGMNAVYDRLMTTPKRARSWPLTRPVTSGRYEGAERFLELLGEARHPFEVSLTSTVIDDVLAAETAIARSSPMVVDHASGGILHYRRAFADDPYIRLWSGLVLREQGRMALAVGEFFAARRLGVDHWRVSWYLAEAAQVGHATDLAIEALMRVTEEAPDFEPARVALVSAERLR